MAPVGPAASAVMSDGTFTDGGVVSRTVTRNDPVAMLPWLSVAVQLTVVVPNGNVDSEAGVQLVGMELSRTSTAVTVKVTMAPDGPLASTTTFGGSVSVGSFCTSAIGVPRKAVTGTSPHTWLPETVLLLAYTQLVVDASQYSIVVHMDTAGFVMHTVAVPVVTPFTWTS